MTCPACEQAPCVCAPFHPETEKLIRDTLEELSRDLAPSTDDKPTNLEN